jgi:undecaprenyl-diphosphatase
VLRSVVARFWSERVDRHSAVGLRLTASVLALMLVVWGFSGLLEEVLDNDTLVRWDRIAHAWFHDRASRAGLLTFDGITTLGSIGVWVLVALVALWLWRSRHHLLLSVWLGSNLGGLVLQMALKTLIHRTRPQYAASYLHGHSYSFPSGHAMQSTIAYVMVVVVGSLASERWRTHRALLLAGAIALVLVIGFSRVYLGVHYPSDVIGGFAAGTAWLLASTILLGLLDDRRSRRAIRDSGPLPHN